MCMVAVWSGAVGSQSAVRTLIHRGHEQGDDVIIHTAVILFRQLLKLFPQLLRHHDTYPDFTLCYLTVSHNFTFTDSMYQSYTDNRNDVIITLWLHQPYTTTQEKKHMENLQVQLDIWKSASETYYNAMSSVCESLSALDDDYLSIGKNSLTMCSDMLSNYINKLECRKGVSPVIPPELQVIMSLLDKLTVDMDVIREVIADDIKVLTPEG